MKILENTKLINFSIILLTLSASYFFVVSANIQKREMDIKEVNLTKFEQCIIDSKNEYMNQWNFQCKENKKAEKCPSLPRIVSAPIENALQENEANCAKLYR